MQHCCTLKSDHVKLNRCLKLRLISPDNQLGLSKFRSEVSIRNEQQRHLNINKNAIHPFSKFRAWYEIYLIYLYGSVLVTKPVDAGFMRMTRRGSMLRYRYYTMFTDFLCWVDIAINFITGFEVSGSKHIELRPREIVRYYMLGPLFIFDVLSSIPKCLLYYSSIPMPLYRYMAGVMSILCLFKFVRIVSCVRCISRTAEYLRVASRGVLFLFCSIIVSLVIIHWMACMQFVVPVLLRKNFSLDVHNNSWFHGHAEFENLFDKRITLQYVHCFFKSSAYILGIRLDLYKMVQPEEYLLAIFTYFIGKILIAFIWIILAVAILNSRLIDIKFVEIINQVEEYMKQKQLPLGLRDRIKQYFTYKYRNKFFKEEVVNNLLSESLRKEATLYVCKSLVKNVELFCELSPIEISTVVEYLIPEIFLPNDVIIHAGTHGDAIYFLSSGTVAVYTRSGKEICHLQDGAYFGELSVILKGQLRLSTVVALETSHVYRLNKRNLDRCLMTNRTVKRKMLKTAEARLKETLKLEDEYKGQLFEQSIRKINVNH